MVDTTGGKRAKYFVCMYVYIRYVRKPKIIYANRLSGYETDELKRDLIHVDNFM